MRHRLFFPAFHFNPQPERKTLRMNTKIFLVLAVFAVAISTFGQVPGFRSPVSPPSICRKDVGLSFIKTAPPGSGYNSHSSPSSGMAAAVAVSGSVAATLRMLEEAAKKPTVPVIVTTPSSDCEVVLPSELQKTSAPPVIVIPADTGITEVHVVPMEPVVKHPVPITVIPMDIMSAK